MLSLITYRLQPCLPVNQHSESGKNRIGYPLIIYHCIDQQFYLTGINQGAEALRAIAGLYNSPFEVQDVLFNGFEKLPKGNAPEITTTTGWHDYRLIQWVPLHHEDMKAYKAMNLQQKITELNIRLEKHLVNELDKYLEIPIPGLETSITDIIKIYTEPMLYKGYEYLSLDISFSANIALPPMITLGNIKALGYGRVVPQA